MMQQRIFIFFAFLSLVCTSGRAQNFFLGADLSYVNQMEDCGVIYRENGMAKDPYQIFADQGANLIRLRLWHTPAWQDTLNDGQRYSDLADVKKSIGRAKTAGMQVLLDFHLSDFWADPDRQIVPAAWAAVVDDLPVLQDSLHRYLHTTLNELAEENLLPDMIQVGNETNKGILQSEAADAAGWVLDWPRNTALFNTAIRAIREVEVARNHPFTVAIHVAGPENADWLLDGFRDNDVTDFDLIGLSYYWAWHQPTTIERTGEIIAALRQGFPGKDVMIFETGYLWTTESNDEANNIINSVQAGYAPASPENQRRWLIDLTKEVKARGGAGVIYWEPAWVSSPCFTPWGQGSHQEHAAFFDFDNELLNEGGAGFLGYNYTGTVGTKEENNILSFRIIVGVGELQIVATEKLLSKQPMVRLTDMNGREVLQERPDRWGRITLPYLPVGGYLIGLEGYGSRLVLVR